MYKTKKPQISIWSSADMISDDRDEDFLSLPQETSPISPSMGKRLENLSIQTTWGIASSSCPSTPLFGSTDVYDFDRPVRINVKEPLSAMSAGDYVFQLDSTLKAPQSPLTPLSPTSQEKRRRSRSGSPNNRTSQACKSCKKAKVKCNSYRPCDHCNKTGLECIDIKSNRRRKATPKKVVRHSRTKHSLPASPKVEFIEKFNKHVITIIEKLRNTMSIQNVVAQHWLNRCINYNPRKPMMPDLTGMGKEQSNNKSLPMGMIISSLYPTPYHSDSKVWLNDCIRTSLGYAMDDVINVSAICSISTIEKSLTFLIQAVDSKQECFQLKEIWLGKGGDAFELSQNIIIKYENNTHVPLYLIRWVLSLTPVKLDTTTTPKHFSFTSKDKNMNESERKQSTISSLKKKNPTITITSSPTNTFNNNSTNYLPNSNYVSIKPIVQSAPLNNNNNNNNNIVKIDPMKTPPRDAFIADPINTPKTSEDEPYFSVEYRPDLDLNTNVLEEELMLNFDDPNSWNQF